MSAALVVKQYDTYPAWQFTLSDSNGPINLTNALAVYIVGVGQATKHTLGPLQCTIVNAAQGEVSYTPTVTDTGTSDLFTIEASIHWSASSIQKVPNSAASNPTIEIDPDLGGASE